MQGLCWQIGNCRPWFRPPKHKFNKASRFASGCAHVGVSIAKCGACSARVCILLAIAFMTNICNLHVVGGRFLYSLFVLQCIVGLAIAGGIANPAR